ncbi:MAG: tail fiber domain-containing protein [Chthoniobacterales bacterium]
MTTSHLRNSISRSLSLITSHHSLLKVLLSALACFASSPTARAISPLPDGGYALSNTAEGTDALFTFTGVFPNNGGENTAIGFETLYHNTNGNHNTACGLQALFSNTTGSANTAVGHNALASNTGSHNTAVGGGTLASNTIGNENTATGRHALNLNAHGSYNTADGEYALASSTSASQNTALGYGAGYHLTTGGNNIDIGNLGVAGEANTIHIGNPVTVVYPDGTTHAAQTKTYIAGFTTAVTGSMVVVNTTTHQIGVMTSSARFKDEIKPMDKASEGILALKPVTFRYKQEIDSNSIPQFGLVAEEVEKVNPDLVTRDSEGKAYTVRYDAVNAMLLNEFLKEHRKVQDLQEQVEKLTAGLEKVSAQLELKKSAPQVVDNQ